MNECNCEDFIISTMKWSFSRLNSFDSGCRLEWKRHYIDCEPSHQSFYGAAGGFSHKILEMYEKGELDMWDLPGYFEAHFAEEVPYDAPPNKYTDLKADWFNKVYEYFENIDLPLDKYQVCGVEKQLDFMVGEYPFIGFIDLFLRDPEDGKYILVDHKSSNIKILKSGKISKSDQEHFLAFKRQQFLYCLPIIEEYGEGCVKELRWNMFRNREWISIPFNKEEYEETIDWAISTIHRIENETEWPPKPDMFFCRNLCGCDYCEYRP